MVGVDWTTVRLFLHVLGATVWVGGQLTLAVLVPVLRPLGREVTRAAARRFNVVAWYAFALLVATGAWNVAVAGPMSASYQRTLAIKLTAVLLSGVAAYAHLRSTRPVTLAVFGALTGVAALAALLLGVMLAG